jgi:ADP-dependent phosphofructokinase/glucokinase
VKYTDRYPVLFDALKMDLSTHLQSKKRFVFGYTSDLDVVLDWDQDAFNRMVADRLKEVPSVKDGDVIETVDDLSRILGYYMLHGLGGEVDITNQAICDYLEKTFKHQYGLGGTGAQGAAAMSAVGFPVLVHITDKSKPVCELMNTKGTMVVGAKGEMPIMQAATDELPVRHIIMQYPKDADIPIGEHIHKVPVSNRLIMDYDQIHKRLPVDEAFKTYLEEKAKDILAYSISGFNAIIDSNIMAHHAKELKAHYKKIKTINPDVIIYLEGAYYLNSDVKNLVFEKLAASIDILGMNEEELVDHTQKHGVVTDKDDLSSVIKGLDLLLDIYPAKAIVMHTKDYSMFYGEKIESLDCEKGLTLGNLMSGTRARIGAYGKIDDLAETLNVPLSEKGVEFANLIKNQAFKRHIELVPSRYLENPKFTIGLGDTFMAGFMLSALKGK